jgi:hypothetical protein
MKRDNTIETSAVVTPKLAIASLTQITSYTSPQNPEITKKAKYHLKCDAAVLEDSKEGAGPCEGDNDMVILGGVWLGVEVNSRYSTPALSHQIATSRSEVTHSALS